MVRIATSTELINIKVDSQRRSMKSILLLFVKPYSAGARYSEEYIFPDLNKVFVTINGSPNMLYTAASKARMLGGRSATSL